jgi:hypothetical protein
VTEQPAPGTTTGELEATSAALKQALTHDNPADNLVLTITFDLPVQACAAILANQLGASRGSAIEPETAARIIADYCHTQATQQPRPDTPGWINSILDGHVNTWQTPPTEEPPPEPAKKSSTRARKPPTPK